MTSSPGSADDRRADAVGRADPGPAVVLLAMALSALIFGAGGFVVGQSTASGDEGGTDPAAADVEQERSTSDDPDDVGAEARDEDEQVSEREGIDEIAAELREDHDGRHDVLVADLTDTATNVHEELWEVLAELYAAVPASGEEDEPASTEQIEAFRATLQDGHDRLTGLGPGSTSVNGARGTFLGAVRQLNAAVTAYEEAFQADDADRRARLVALTAELRDDAVALWTVGAEQLDLLNIEAHGGHVHLYLPDSGDPDTLPDEFREPVGADQGDHDDDHDDHDHAGG